MNGSEVSRPTLTTRPKYAANSSPHSACRPDSRPSRPPSQVFLLVLAALFAAYLRLSKTYPENSDEANILLMAADLAHGNLYLSGWNVSDVPFITTELPEIALLVKLFGLHLDTAHIAAALTYTVVVAIALLLAKGRSRGPEAITRMGIALAIMLAPRPGVGVFVMVFSVGHIGTAAPVMLAWLVLDRCWPAGDATARAPRRLWCLPVAVGALLAWALMADPLVLVIAVCPVLVVAGLRLVPGLMGEIPNGSALRHLRHTFADRWLAASLAAAAGAFFLPGNAINRLGPGNYVAAPPLSGLAEAVAVTRLACVALALLGACAIARRFFRRDADLVSQLLRSCPSPRSWPPARSATGLASGSIARGATPGRTKAAGLSQLRVLALVALLGWYGFGLFQEARIPAATNPFARHTASFVLESSGAGYFSQWLVSPAPLRHLGTLLPAASRATLDPGEGYTVHAYQGNLPGPIAAPSPLLALSSPRQLPADRNECAVVLVIATQAGYFRVRQASES